MHPEKVQFPMITIELGIKIAIKDLHHEKELSLIVVIELERETEVRAEQ